MENGSQPPESTGSQARIYLLFMVKLVAMLAGLAAFGMLVFWLRRSMH